MLPHTSVLWRGMLHQLGCVGIPRAVTYIPASLTHHFVGVIPVVFHAVLHQLLLVQVPGPAVRTHERGAVGNVAAESKDELRPPGKGLD